MDRNYGSHGLDVRIDCTSIIEIMAHFFSSGNFLIISCSTSIAIALTWAGLTYDWSSWHVLVPLCIGGVGLVAFFLYEFWLAKQPLVSLQEPRFLS